MPERYRITVPLARCTRCTGLIYVARTGRIGCICGLFPWMRPAASAPAVPRETDA